MKRSRHHHKKICAKKLIRIRTKRGKVIATFKGRPSGRAECGVPGKGWAKGLAAARRAPGARHWRKAFGKAAHYCGVGKARTHHQRKTFGKCMKRFLRAVG